MLNNLNVKVVSALMRGQIYVQQRPAEPQPAQTEAAEAPEAPRQNAPQPQVERAMPEKRTDYSQYRASKESLPGQEEARRAASAPQGEKQRPMPVVKNGPKVGRNDLCPCGSGKKYKNCHGRGL